jgi:drug/metabolite transporter (DMT)-like permease
MTNPTMADATRPLRAPQPARGKRATLIGFSAILMWSLLALFTAASGAVPPFQLAAMTFAIGALVGFAWIAAKRRGRDLRQPWPVWVVGILGLFGYHALYFTALRNAPPVEAGLIAYLWPLLIVVFSALLPGERLRWFHVAGAILGLAGTILIVSKGGVAFEPAYALGYLAALGCALTWSAYSILSRRFRDVPTAVVAGFCLATSLLSALVHLLFEATVWPAGAGQWLAVAGLGLMPVGAAFYVWDHGVKRGDIQLLGAASYLAPLLSTLILILAGFGAFSAKIALAALLITGGAALASLEVLRRTRRPATASQAG